MFSWVRLGSINAKLCINSCRIEVKSRSREALKAKIHTRVTIPLLTTILFTDVSIYCTYWRKDSRSDVHKYVNQSLHKALKYGWDGRSHTRNNTHKPTNFHFMKPCAFDDHGAEMNRESWSLTSPTMLPAMMQFCISKLIPVPLRHIRENSNLKYK